jgi:predicted amidophosphoribosyltransferase
MSLIWPCPDCQGDLDDEGFSLYCPACERPVPYDIMTPDPDDERDRMIDQEEASRDHR